MRTRGWAGDVPSSDEEAVARILEATRRTIDERGEQMGIADVARTLGVTRQTVYHYFANTYELLSATAIDATSAFLDELAEVLAGITDPGEAVAEGLATTIERLPRDPYLGLMLQPERKGAFAITVTNDTARVFGRSILERLDVDWTQFDQQGIDDIVEIMLRTLQSLILAPLSDSPGGEELRRLLRVWVAPSVNNAQRSDGLRLGPRAARPTASTDV